MKDKKYNKFIESIAAEYLQLSLDLEIERMRKTLEYYSAMARSVIVIQELKSYTLHADLNYPNDIMVDLAELQGYMEDAGVKDAFDAHGVEILRHFRMGALSKLDWVLLRDAGVKDPVELLKKVESKAHQLSEKFEKKELSIEMLFNNRQEDLQQKINNAKSSTEKRKRKWPKAILRLCLGGVNIAGDILLGAGALAAFQQASAASVLTSCTAGIVMVSDGVEQLFQP